MYNSVHLPDIQYQQYSLWNCKRVRYDTGDPLINILNSFIWLFDFIQDPNQNHKRIRNYFTNYSNNVETLNKEPSA